MAHLRFRQPIQTTCLISPSGKLTAIAAPSSGAEAEGLVGVKTADWSKEVAPFWLAVIQSALTTQGLAGLLKAGWTTIKVCPSIPAYRSLPA